MKNFKDFLLEALSTSDQNDIANDICDQMIEQLKKARIKVWEGSRKVRQGSLDTFLECEYELKCDLSILIEVDNKECLIVVYPLDKDGDAIYKHSIEETLKFSGDELVGLDKLFKDITEKVKDITVDPRL